MSMLLKWLLKYRLISYTHSFCARGGTKVEWYIEERR